jgi:hypothetical protein
MFEKASPTLSPKGKGISLPDMKNFLSLKSWEQRKERNSLTSFPPMDRILSVLEGLNPR